MNRIKLQLYAIELCALLLLLCMFVLSFQRVQALAEEKQEIYLENALSQAAQGVERKLADIAASRAELRLQRRGARTCCAPSRAARRCSAATPPRRATPIP